jgi:hypothetical protein
VPVTDELYHDTLDIAGSMPDQRVKRKRALQRAYQQRTFEIEHYWKRAGYFWGFQLAIFAAFGLIWKDVGGPQQWGPLALALSSLGILTALANWLSALGSKFWQENWEKHIDMLENEFEGRLYKTVWLSDGKRQYSVSKVNLALSGYFIVFWVIVFIYVACRFLDLHVLTHLSWLVSWLGTPQMLYVVLFACLSGLGSIWLFSRTTTLNGTIPTTDGPLKPAVPLCSLVAWLRSMRARLPTLAKRWCKRVHTGSIEIEETVLLRRNAPNELAAPRE